MGDGRRETEREGGGGRARKKLKFFCVFFTPRVIQNVSLTWIMTEFEPHVVQHSDTFVISIQAFIQF